jgi:Putative transposase/Transposase zinc-binding domain
MNRPALELADVVRAAAADLAARTPLTTDQRRALRDVGRCRTAALGGHVAVCGGCGHRRIAYNSCRNRHCPKCCASQQAEWLAREAANLLPVEYHHVVFTLPAEVHPVGLANPVAVYDALLGAAADAVRAVAADPKYLGAEVGLLLVLHTWGQTLSYHPHAHAVATGGGLTPDGRWASCRPGFFLPVRVLGRVFRGKFLARLREAFTRGRLAGFAGVAAFEAWAGRLRAKDWVVYSQPPFGGPAVVLKYLARYTHRVAIGNSRLVSLAAGRVTFTYKDYADAARTKAMTLDGVEFLRRWVTHVLPRGFVKVRHSGLLANRHREANLAVCRRRLFASGRWSAPRVAEPAARPAPCPVCGRQAWAIGGRFGPVGVGRVACGAVARVDSS